MVGPLRERVSRPLRVVDIDTNRCERGSVTPPPTLDAPKRRSPNVPTPTASQLFVLDLLKIVCADACRTYEDELSARSKTFVANRYRMLFLTLARELARKPNGRPAQLTLLAAYVRREHPSVMHVVSEGNRMLAGDTSMKQADEFRYDAATVLDHLAAARIGSGDLVVRAGWMLPPPSRMASSIVPLVIEQIGRARYEAYLNGTNGP